jgi:hypothetical protein
VRHLRKTTFNIGFRLSAFLLTVILASPVHAYNYPLSPEAVREAYFFGRSSDSGKVAEFLGEYIRVFHSQNGNTFPGRIELRTPYQRVVQRSWEIQAAYSAQQAEIDYAAQVDTVEVRVYLVFDNSLPGSSNLYTDSDGRVRDHRENFWRDYRFRVTQEHLIEPRKLEGTPRYTCCGEGLSGARVRLEFNASTLTPGRTRVEVMAPDGRKITADFALDQLK